MISFRIMKYGDIPAGLMLCRAAGWNQVARDWEVFLHLSPNGCLVAIDGNKVVGTVATIRYQHFFSWIGMVLIDPAYQRQGIGKELLKEALHILHNEQTIKLDATPAGRFVYEKLDFFNEYPLSRMVCTGFINSALESYARPLNTNDVAAVSDLDRTVFGAGRQAILKWMLESAPQLAFIIEESNEVQGYCLGRIGYGFTHIGPVIAKNLHVAKHLVVAALNKCTGNAVVLDILCFDPEWRKWLTEIGFTEERAFIRMYKGSNNFSCLPGNQFAVVGPEFG